MNEEVLNEKRIHCWNKAVHAYGTAWFFRERANKFKKKLQLLSFGSLLVPVLVGGVVLSFGTESNLLTVMLSLTGFFSLVLFAISLWSMSKGWQDAYAESLNSSKANTRLYQSWEDAAKKEWGNPSLLETKILELNAIDRVQEEIDLNLGITDRDKRMMMRRGLIQYSRRCATCKKEPKDMKPTENCITCANF